MNKAMSIDMIRLCEILGIPMLRNVKINVPLGGPVIVETEFFITQKQASEITDMMAEQRK